MSSLQRDLPMVSVITPSYNQGRYIRETIESVLRQNYPHLEHIVVDGGSTDETLSILQHYASTDPRFRYVSEPDRGQSHAINKGLAMARGEIIGWVNSDDTYLPRAIEKAVQALRLHPEWAIVTGNGYIIDENSKIQYPVHYWQTDVKQLYHSCPVIQPTAFLHKSVFQQLGGVDESLRFCMDYDLWIRLSKNHAFGFIRDYLANARVHSTCKSATQWNTIGFPEVLKTVVKHYGSISTTWMGYARKLGIPYIIHQCKSNALFGNSPKIAGMNRFPDLWVPPRFTITVESDPGSPAISLLIRGAALLQGPARKFISMATVNGQSCGTFETTLPNFTWEIPLDRSRTQNVVTLFSSQFTMNQAHEQNTKRAVSFMAQEVVPLSAEEAAFYRILLQVPSLKQG
ncbi:glycosyltransferase family 2 protein [Brevibacillus sp. GCM10020057]|uniref:glycosyltransferase family 2 protein n=1 Tax=Brevibacillus sp. GCM10020057 TaxID=3317327 RepID=UPI0036456801